MAKEISLHVRKAILADGRSGLYTIGEITLRNNLRRLATVSQILDAAGIDIVSSKRAVREQKKKTAAAAHAFNRAYQQLEADEPIIDAAKTGLYSIRALAKHFDYTPTGIRNVLQRNNIDLSLILEERKHSLERLLSLLLLPQHSLLTLLDTTFGKDSGMRGYYEDLADYCQTTLRVGKRCLGKQVSVSQLADFLEARDAGFSYHDSTIYAGFASTRREAHAYYSGLRYVATAAAPYLFAPTNI